MNEQETRKHDVRRHQGDEERVEARETGRLAESDSGKSYGKAAPTARTLEETPSKAVAPPACANTDRGGQAATVASCGWGQFGGPPSSKIDVAQLPRPPEAHYASDGADAKEGRPDSDCQAKDEAAAIGKCAQIGCLPSNIDSAQLPRPPESQCASAVGAKDRRLDSDCQENTGVSAIAAGLHGDIGIAELPRPPEAKQAAFVGKIAADTLPRPPEHEEFGEVSLAEITELVTVEATKQGSSQETIAILVDEISRKWLESKILV